MLYTEIAHVCSCIILYVIQMWIVVYVKKDFLITSMYVIRFIQSNIEEVAKALGTYIRRWLFQESSKTFVFIYLFGKHLNVYVHIYLIIDNNPNGVVGSPQNKVDFKTCDREVVNSNPIQYTTDLTSNASILTLARFLQFVAQIVSKIWKNNNSNVQR